MKRILFHALLLAVLVHFLPIGEGLAQRPKAMSKDLYKSLKKKAKKNDDAKAMLQIADAHKGNMFTSDELRHYKKALKWYDKARETNQEKTHLANSLFELNFTGDKYIDRNLSKAKQYLERVDKERDLNLIFEDNTNIYLPNIFKIYEDANHSEATAEELFELGRYLMEYQIDYDMGKKYLDKAEVAGHPDAAYQKAKWDYFRRYRRELVDSIPYEYQKEQAHEVMKEYAQKGSPRAQLEYAYYLIQNSEQPHLLEAEVEKLLRNLLVKKYANKEQQIKALYLSSKTKKGRDELISLRRLAQLKKENFESEQFPFMDDALAQHKKIEAQLETLTGLGKMIQENPALIKVPLSLPDYYQQYNGDIKPLIAVKDAISKPEYEEFLTQKNISRYKQTLLEQVEPLFEKANTPAELYSFKIAMESDKFFKPLAAPYLDSLIQQQLDTLGLVKEDLVYEYEKQQLTQKTFSSLEDGRKYITALQARDDLDPEPPAPKYRWMRKPKKEERRKNDLLRKAKYKVLEDIFGDEPTVKQIQDINDKIYRYTFLSPIGAEWAANLKSDSESWFNGIVDVKKTRTQYFYEVKRLGDSDQFLMDIKSIRNNKSNNAYSTRINLDTETKNGEVASYDVTILGSKYKTYGWKLSEKDYFRVVCSPESNMLGDAKCTGFMTVNRDKSFKDSLKKQKKVSDSQKEAIRAVVRYFILEMHRTFGIR